MRWRRRRRGSRGCLQLGALVALALSSVMCGGKMWRLPVREPTRIEELQLARACGWDASTDQLTRCPEYEKWYREALALCVKPDDSADAEAMSRLKLKPAD
jgi:hypothetical protein